MPVKRGALRRSTANADTTPPPFPTHEVDLRLRTLNDTLPKSWLHMSMSWPTLEPMLGAQEGACELSKLGAAGTLTPISPLRAVTPATTPAKPMVVDGAEDGMVVEVGWVAPREPVGPGRWGGVGW